jgi:hypothetical protein
VSRGDQDDGPRGFARRWLSFDDSRPVRTRLLWKFIGVVAACLAVSAALALIGH